ncbi:MAG: hypothetical protein EA376_05735 [Phycisphaeraceae bacterium]|nr:MAG: hypothetical protein EA376_05735 [Phycisphaeraceae bacterium]
MRFDFGSVDAIQPPPLETRRLHEFHEDMPAPLFRVKVTDVRETPGRLLADAQKIRPVDPDEKPDQRRGILFTSWRDNDGPVWELEFEDPRGPQLFIDKTADPHHDLPGTPEFRALVYPEIIRRSLTWVLIDEEGKCIEDPEFWHGRWLNFPRDAFGFREAPPASGADSAEKRMWIDEAVKWCSQKAGLCRSIAPQEESE